jgi:uncharacterized membrane protein
MKLLHIIAGLTALASGAVALYSLKGGKLHRQSGVIFVFTMWFMSLSGAVLAIIKPDRISIVAGLLTFYLVTTALLTVRRPAQGFNWTDATVSLFGSATGVTGLTFCFNALNSASGKLDGMPPHPAFLFGTIALLAVLGDVRMMRRGIKGKRRIARHFWRMCFALWIAASSFFLGQAQVFPPSIRIFPLLAIPPLSVLVILLYWLWRTLHKKRCTQP